jgi:hypothetical protein
MSAQHFDIGAHTDVLVGKPAVPVSGEAIAALSLALGDLGEVVEAHLAQCFIPRVSEAPALVLIIVVRENTSAEHLMDVLAPRLARIVPPSEYLDVWPLPANHRILSAVRAAGCAILRRDSGSVA